jgi:hypothetical protein
VQLAPGALADVRADVRQHLGHRAHERDGHLERVIPGRGRARGLLRHGLNAGGRPWLTPAPARIPAHPGDTELLVETKMRGKLGHGFSYQTSAISYQLSALETHLKTES